MIWRIALLGVLTTVIASIVLISCRLTALWGLPDALEPFDLAASAAPEVPADRDALALYPLAAAHFQPLGQPDWPGQLRKAVTIGWPAAAEGVRSCLRRNRQMLDLWRQAADRTETTLRRPDDPDLLAEVPPYALFLLAQLEASRLETDGNLDEAWAWHRACLRMMRHIQDYDPLRRAADTQQSFFPVALAGVKRWCSDPRLGVPLLQGSGRCSRFGHADNSRLRCPQTRVSLDRAQTFRSAA